MLTGPLIHLGYILEFISLQAVMLMMSQKLLPMVIAEVLPAPLEIVKFLEYISPLLKQLKSFEKGHHLIWLY